LYTEPLFVVAKIIGSPGEDDNLLFSLKIVLSVIMTITLLLRLARHEQLCDVRMCCVCKLDIWMR